MQLSARELVPPSIWSSLQWIEDAGIIVRCYNLAQTQLPLDGNAEEDVFKVYMRDTGLFLYA